MLGGLVVGCSIKAWVEKNVFQALNRDVLFNSSHHGLMNNEEVVWIITVAAEGENLKGWFRC